MIKTAKIGHQTKIRFFKNRFWIQNFKANSFKKKIFSPSKPIHERRDYKYFQSKYSKIKCRIKLKQFFWFFMFKEKLSESLQRFSFNGNAFKKNTKQWSLKIKFTCWDCCLIFKFLFFTFIVIFFLNENFSLSFLWVKFWRSFWCFIANDLDTENYFKISLTTWSSSFDFILSSFYASPKLIASFYILDTPCC